VSIISIESELMPVPEESKTYANCDDALAAGPIAKNVWDWPDGAGPAEIVAVVVAKLVPAVSSVTVRVTVQVQTAE
jgi:hypothetical protein